MWIFWRKGGSIYQWFFVVGTLCWGIRHSKPEKRFNDCGFAIFFITQLYSLWSYIWSMRDHWAWPCSDNNGMHPRCSGELGVLSNKEYIYFAKHFNKHKPVRQVVAKNSGPSSSSVSASPPPCCSAPPESPRWSGSTVTLEIGQFSSAMCVTLNMKSLGC